MTTPQPSRRLWKAALAVVVVFAAVAWLVAFPAFKRHRAIQEIERLGGRVTRTTVGPQWLRQWGIGFDHIVVVEFEETEITDDGLKYFSGLTNLQHLYLDNTEIGDKGLRYLSGLTNLELLWLRGTRISNDGLKHLSGLTNLEKLFLENTEIDDHGLKHLSVLKNLEFLSIIHTHVTDDGVERLRESLPNCDIVHEGDFEL